MDHNFHNVPTFPVLDQAPPGAPLRTPKRRKIAVACEECRARKIRCDGKRPACGPCSGRAENSRLHVNCVYLGKSAHRTGAPEFERGEMVRGRAVTWQGQSHHLAQAPHDEAHRFPRSLDGGGGPSPADRLASGSNPVLPAASPQVLQATTRDRQRRDNDTEGANAMVGEVATDEIPPARGFFGSSSAADFMRQIKTAVNREVPYPGKADGSSSLFGRVEKAGLPGPSAISHHALPTRRTADRLMEIYWNVVFPLYPFFDREQLQAEYLKLWSGEEGSSAYSEDMQMCIFNVIFALGCQLAEFIEPEDRLATADSFFSRARDLLQFDYLQSTDSADQCWMVTGMAIRSAQGLGLHIPETISRLGGHAERELAKRIWHGCVLMDRVVALTLGRPAMISKEAASAIPLPIMISEVYSQLPMESGASQAREKPSPMAFYAKSLELYEILNNILLSVYKDTTASGRPEDPHHFYFHGFHEGQLSVLRLDYALSTWWHNLPPYLRIQPGSSCECRIIERQSIVLRSRFLHIRMVLLRPILSRYCDIYARETLISPEDSLPQRFALQCSILCVKSAQDLIGLIHTYIPPDGSIGRLAAWWYNILYIYTAATVLIAGRLQPVILAEVAEESVENSWIQALEILQKYQRYSRSAQRCLVALELLHGQASSSTAAVGSQRQPVAARDAVHDVPPREEFPTAGVGNMDIFGLPDFLDMSWLDSVPSSLY